MNTLLHRLQGNYTLQADGGKAAFSLTQDYNGDLRLS